MKTCSHQASFQLTSMQILIHLVFNELSGEIISITFYFYNIRMGKPNITKHKAYNREWKELIVLSIKIK